MKQRKVKQNKVIKYVDWFIIVVNVLTNIALLFLTNDLLNGITYNNGFYYTFTPLRYIELAIFGLAQVTGLYLIVKLFIKQGIKGKLLIITLPLTILLVVGLWLFYNAQNININSSLTFSALVGITQSTYDTIGFEYVFIALIIYVVIIYCFYSFVLNKFSRVKNK